MTVISRLNSNDLKVLFGIANSMNKHAYILGFYDDRIITKQNQGIRK